MPRIKPVLKVERQPWQHCQLGHEEEHEAATQHGVGYCYRRRWSFARTARHVCAVCALRRFDTCLARVAIEWCAYAVCCWARKVGVPCINGVYCCSLFVAVSCFLVPCVLGCARLDLARNMLTSTAVDVNSRENGFKITFLDLGS